MKAKDITGEAFHHTVGDVDTLQELARMLPPNPVIVNIGACFGTSTLAMLEARPDAFIFSIDINICPKEPEHITMAGLDAGRVIRVLGPSQNAGVYWPHPVDMVFVDGAHGYPEVVRDSRAWRDKIKAGGILAFHDYDKDILPHVKRAVDDEMGDTPILLQAESIRAYQLWNGTG
jgi:predicted O-methyltransferase YrrM